MNRLRPLLLCLAPLALLAAAPAGSASGAAAFSGVDASIAPGDDFFGYANGGWFRDNPIPPDRASYGVSAVLSEQARTRVVELIRESADGGQGTQARKVGDAYQSYLDEAAVEAKGLAPLKPQLDAIAAIADKKALARALGAQLRADVDPLNATNFETPHLFGLFVSQGLTDPSVNMPFLLQGGLGLGDREYYVSTQPKMATLRTQYEEHVAVMLGLAGFGAPKEKAAKVMALELRLAQVHATRTESEDVSAPQVVPRAELATRAPGLDWSTFLEAASLGSQPSFTLWHPKAIAGLSALVASEPLESWKLLLAAHALDEAAPLLSKAFVTARFEFYGKVLRGVPAQRERWKRAVDFTSRVLPDAVGQLYVARYFSPQAKAQVTALVQDVVKAFGKRIQGLTWMAPDTRKRALEKLSTLKVGVGYPDTWIDDGPLEIRRDDLLGNAQRAEAFVYARALAKLGKPPDRSEWWMAAQEVNALNMPLLNALNFPAAILQPPYFDPAAEPLVNYAGIGATIGHEICHSFDNVGAAFDAQGRLHNWWTPEDLAHFNAEAERLAAQFDAYEPLPGLKVNGHQTNSENIADVAGLAAAYDAWKLSLKGKPAPVKGGLTGDQRFFLSFAQSWREVLREEALRAQVVADGHAPAQYRGDAVRNFDAWYTAFKVKPGQKLYLAPAARVRVW
jgi:putative endopeptidase